MRIVILGSGAAGSVFAAYLKKGGADDITLVDLYKEHLDEIKRNGLTLNCPEGEFTFKGYKTAETAAGLGIMDIIILMVKCTQTESVLKSARECIGPKTVIVTLQNGLGNEEPCMKFVSEDRIIYGSGNIATRLPRPGYCVAQVHEGLNVQMGPVKKIEHTDRVGKYLEDCFRKGGLNPKYFDDVRPYIWKKVASNSGNNTVCAVLGLNIREVETDAAAHELVHGIFREAAEVSEAMGIAGVREFILEDQPAVVAQIGDYYPSMAQDVLMYHRQTEVDYLTGAISRYGKKFGVPTPTCDILTLVIKAKQANYKNTYKENNT